MFINCNQMTLQLPKGRRHLAWPRPLPSSSAASASEPHIRPLASHPPLLGLISRGWYLVSSRANNLVTNTHYCIVNVGTFITTTKKDNFTIFLDKKKFNMSSNQVDFYTGLKVAKTGQMPENMQHSLEKTQKIAYSMCLL